MANASPFTHAGNFISAVVGGVDPRTGQFTMNFSIASLLCNNTLGPRFPLALNYSPMSAGNPFGLGKGFTPGLTWFDDRPGKGLLQLSTGEQYKTRYTDKGELILQQHKVDTIRLNVVQSESGNQQKKIYVTWKTGEREVLEMVGGQEIYYPTRKETPLGHALMLVWDKAFRLSAVLDMRGGRAICTFDYPAEGITRVHILPLTAESTELVLSQQNDYLTSVRQICASGDLVWTLSYDDVTDHLFAGQRPLNAVTYPTGLKEWVVYEGQLMKFRTDKGEGALPAVVRYTRSPGAGQQDMIRTYIYSATNFMGYGAEIQHFDADHDNLYNVLSPYDYWSKETQTGDPLSAVSAVSTERHYNNYHLLVSEKETMEGSPCSTMRTTAYYAEPGRQFIDQPVTFQSPRQQTVTWSDGTASREEITRFEYDAFGNLAKKTDPDGTVTRLTYYPAAGEGENCPPEPSGFTRFLKQKTVTPAPGEYAVPVHQTGWCYRAFPVHTASTLSGAVVQSAMEQRTTARKLTTTHYEYLNDPASYDHGRMLSQTHSVVGPDGVMYPVVDTFGCDTTQSGRVSQTITTTVDDEPGKKDSPKLSLTRTRTLSSLTGLLLGETNAAGNSVTYQWDDAGRLLSRTFHPDKKGYEAQDTWRYTLPDAATHTPASTTGTDIRGNQTRTDVDGCGRVIARSLWDTDGSLGWQQMSTARYDVQGRAAHNTYTDVFRSPQEAGNVLHATFSRTWDGWGTLATERHQEQGLTTCLQSDPVGKVWPDKKALGRLTTVESWSVAESDASVTAKVRQYYDLAGRPVVTERFAVTKDGKSWETLPYSQSAQVWDTAHRLRVATDTLGRSTAWQYDDMGRTLATTFADGTVVKRAYAPFSTAPLVTRISLTPAGGKEQVLGERHFDGLGRGRNTTCGGRTTRLTYESAWQQQPSAITGPDGTHQVLITDPLLDEAPLGIAASGNAADVSQIFGYELKTGLLTLAEEKETTMTLTTWPSGRPQTEITRVTGHDGPAMQWGWSLGGIPEQYTGVDGTIETRHWSSVGRLTTIVDPQVTVTLDYDALSRLSGWLATAAEGEMLRTRLTFDALGREATRTLDYQTDGVKDSQVFIQSWTPADQLQTRTLVQNGETVRVETFGYDARNRLQDYRCGGSALPVDAWGNAFTRQLFTFDALGNILTCTTALGSGGEDIARFHYDNQADPCQLTGISHSLTSHYPAQIALKYDPAGRLVQDEEGRTLTYDALGRLHTLSGSLYGYDACNRLISQTLDSTRQTHRLYYRAGRLVAEWVTGHPGEKTATADSQVRLVYAGDSCAAQTIRVADATETLLTGTDNKSSVVLSAQAATTRPMTYTPHGYLPPHHALTLNNDPDSVTTATDFRLEFPDSTSSLSATIYSNGRNQVAVMIKTVLLDKNQDIVNLSASQLWACLTLKTTRDVVIKKQPPDPRYDGLSVWNAPGDFTHAVHYDPDGQPATGPADRDSTLLVFLSTAELAGAYEIFAELSFKHFSETTEGGSGEGHFESRLKINTLPEVDYGTSELWTMKRQLPSDEQTFRARDISGQREDTDWYFYAQEYRLTYGGQHNEFYSFVETGETFREYKSQTGSATETHLYCARPVSAMASWATQGGDRLTICTWAHLAWPLDIYGPNIGYQASHWAIKGLDAAGMPYQPVYGTLDTHQVFAERHSHDYLSLYRAEIYATHEELGLTEMDTLFPNQLNTSKICVTDVFGNTGRVSVGYRGGSADPIFPSLDEPATLAVTLANTLLNTRKLSGRQPFVIAADTPDAQQTVQSVQDHAITWTVTKLAKHALAGEAHSLMVLWNAQGTLPETLPVPEAAQQGTVLAQGPCFSAIYMNTDTFIDDMPAVGESVHVSAADIAAALDGASGFTPQRVVLAGHAQSPLYHLSEDPSHYDMDTVLQRHFSVWCYVDDEWTLYGPVNWDSQRSVFI